MKRGPWLRRSIKIANLLWCWPSELQPFQIYIRYSRGTLHIPHTNVAISFSCYSKQGRNEGGKGIQFPGRQIIARGRRKVQQCHKYLNYRIFASEKLQVWTLGCRTCFLPRAPSNLVTPLTQEHDSDRRLCFVRTRLLWNVSQQGFKVWFIFCISTRVTLSECEPLVSRPRSRQTSLDLIELRS